MFDLIIALGPKMALIRVSIVLQRLIKGNMKNLQVSACLLTSAVDKNKCEVTH